MEKIENAKKLFEKNVNEYRNLESEIWKNATDFLTQFLKENNNKIDDEDERGLLDGIGVVYDGGNHPEYAMGLSSVLSISLDENDKLMFALEEEEVSVDRIETNDLLWIVEQIISLM